MRDAIAHEFSNFPPSPAGRSKNANLREAFFGRGECRHILGVHGASPFAPPEIAKGDFDLPAGEVSRCPLAVQLWTRLTNAHINDAFAGHREALGGNQEGRMA